MSACIKWTFVVLGAACLALNGADSANADPPPPVSPQAQAAGLVDVLVHQDLAQGLAADGCRLR